VRIDSLEVHHVSMPLKYPWRTSYGEDKNIHSLLVRVTSEAVSAWSESAPLFAPTYLTESAGGAFYNISEIMAPHIVGHEYETADELNRRLEIFKGNSFAKAAIEIAWWTLQSKLTSTPLHKLLGGHSREVHAGADFGIQDSFDMLIENINNAVEAGFPRIKLKVARGWDLDMLKVVRSAFPNTTFHIDCNGGYSLDDMQLFEAIDRLDLAFIEQPLHYADLLDHAELAKRIETPVCLDESITSVRSARQALDVGACTIVNIKPARVGGLANAVAIHDLCRDNGVPVWVGGMLESAVGAAVCIELATLENFSYPGDLFPSDRFYENDLSSPPIALTNRLTFEPFTDKLPEPDPVRLKQCTVQTRTISSRN